MAEEVVEAATMEESMKNKVMVAIDDSEYSQHALNWALKTLASTIADSELVIYTARTPVDISYLYASSWGSKFLSLYMYIEYMDALFSELIICWELWQLHTTSENRFHDI